MGARGRTPEKGVSGRTFTHDRCQDDKPRTGWLSGDIHVLVMHVGKGRSKPCERALVGCACDQTCSQWGRPTEEIGFVPLRRDDGKPVCVLVRKAKIDFVAHMRPGCSVVWGRQADRFEGVYVRPAAKELPWSHYFSGKPDDDMGYWLPIFLGVQHLGDAMRAWFGKSDTGMSLQPAESLPPPVANNLPPAVAQEHDRINEMLAGRTLDDTVSSLRRKSARLRLKEGEQNGVH